MCHYNKRKYSFCARVVNIWNSLPNEMVKADTVSNLVYIRLFVTKTEYNRSKQTDRQTDTQTDEHYN